jgi:hypothetical protein
MDGKVANQRPRGRWVLNCVPVEVTCENCNKRFGPPVSTSVKGVNYAQEFAAFSYLGSDKFIYDTKSGRSVCYCSDFCRKSHNHRFRG